MYSGIHPTAKAGGHSASTFVNEFLNLHNAVGHSAAQAYDGTVDDVVNSIEAG